MSLITKNYFLTHHEVIASLIDDMASNGIYPADNSQIIADGQLHRFRDKNDKPNANNCWYVLYPGNVPAGAYGSWKQSIKINWCYKSLDQITPSERIEYLAQVELSRRLAKEATVALQGEAADRAREIWETASLAQPSHPYLQCKRITAFGARESGTRLVLPIVDFNNKLYSLQFIDHRGNKRLLKDGAKSGNFIPIRMQDNDEGIYIGEGFSTCATIAMEIPSVSVIAAIDAGNLRSVAVKARERFPTLKIVICADDDRLKEGNPGMTKAREAAIYASAQLIIPIWPDGSPGSLSDFNDLACWKLAKGEVLA